MGTTVKSQSSEHVLFLGTGYVAKALIPALKARNYRVSGTTRDTPGTLERLGINPIIFDGEPNSALSAALERATIIISSIPPVEGRDPVIAAHPNLIDRAKNLKWAGYLSATSVYGDRGGQWVFEDELLRPSTQRGRDRVAAELDWLESGLPAHIFRLAGIYGPEIGGTARNPFQKLRDEKARAVIKPGHIVNRIHVDDIVSALLAAIDTPNPAQAYNLADGNPAQPQDVLDFAAELIGAPRPPHVPLETADISDMARSFYQDNKRVSNMLAKQTFGWVPQHTDYKAGLTAIAKLESRKTSS